MNQKIDENDQFRTFLVEIGSDAPGVRTVFDCFPLQGVVECSIPFPDLCVRNNTLPLIEKGVIFSDKTNMVVPYILTEQVQGRPLSKTTEFFNEPESLWIGIQLIEAIEALHQSNLAHGNPDTNTILTQNDGRVKITGFGIQSPLFQEYHSAGSLHDAKTNDLNSLVEIIRKLIPHRFVEAPEFSRLSLSEMKEKLKSLGGANEDSQKTIAEKVRSTIRFPEFRKGEPGKGIKTLSDFQNWLGGRGIANLLSPKSGLIFPGALSVIAREWFRIQWRGLIRNVDWRPLCNYTLAAFQPNELLFSEQDRNQSVCFTVLYQRDFIPLDILIDFIGKQELGKVVIGLVYDEKCDFSVIRSQTGHVSRNDTDFFVKALYLPGRKGEARLPSSVLTGKHKEKTLRIPDWLPKDYFEKLREECGRLDPVLQRHRHFYDLTLRDAIELSLERKDDSETFLIRDILEKRLFEARNLILLGGAGAGKTTLTRQLVLECLEKEAHLRNEIPVYLPLGLYQPGKLNRFFQEASVFGDVLPISECAEMLAQGGPWLFILDGYDELADPDRFWMEWESIRISSQSRFFITGRFLQDLPQNVPHGMILFVKPMVPAQIERFVRVYEPERSTDVAEFIRKQNLRAEASTPLWLLFIMLVLRIPPNWRAEILQQKRLTRGGLYRLLIEYYFFGWEETKGVFSIPSEVKGLFLSFAAFQMNRELSVRLTYKEICDIYDANREKYFREYPLNLLLDEILASQILIQASGVYKFPHKTFQEYFAALLLMERIRPENFHSYLNYVWYESLRFCVGLMPCENASVLLRECVFQKRILGKSEEMATRIGRRQVHELLFELDEEIASDISEVRSLKQRIEDQLRAYYDSKNESDAELGIVLAMLFPAQEALEWLIRFSEHSQTLQIEAIDKIGEIQDIRAVELSLGPFMRSEDERILRRVVNSALIPWLKPECPIACQAREMIWKKLNYPPEPGLSERQWLKRRWHLLHALAPDYDEKEDGHLVRHPREPMHDMVALVYLRNQQNSQLALELLTKNICGNTDRSPQHLEKALKTLQKSEDFFIRRAAAHFCRHMEIDYLPYIVESMKDGCLEVRFSAVTSLRPLCDHHPELTNDVIQLLMLSIIQADKDEEEHFRQVALIEMQKTDENTFFQLAFTYLRSPHAAMRVDLIHAFRSAEGFWLQAAIWNLKAFLNDPNESDMIKTASESVLDLINPFDEDRHAAVLLKTRKFKSVPVPPNHSRSEEKKMNVKIIEDKPMYGIITALSKEFAAVKAMLVDPKQIMPGDHDTNVYFVGTMPGADDSGLHPVVLTQLGKMGNNMAAVASTHLLRSFPSINEVLMVGIAGGLPEAGVRLGDIVVCDEHGVVQYDNLKIDSEKIEIRDSSSSPSAFLIKRLRLMEAERIEGKYPWEEYIKRASQLENSARPDSSTDPLFSCDDSIRELRPDKPRVHYGAIGSSNILLKNPDLRDALGSQLGIKAVEMEGSGIADASWDLKQGYIVIRGICDYCDENKNDLWQGYAAVVAAAYMRALLGTIPAMNSKNQENHQTHWT